MTIFKTNTFVKKIKVTFSYVGKAKIGKNVIPKSYHNNVSIEKAGQGHAILVWSDDVLTDNANIRSQRINQSCETLWSSPEEGGLMICSENVPFRARAQNGIFCSRFYSLRCTSFLYSKKTSEFPF